MRYAEATGTHSIQTRSATAAAHMSCELLMSFFCFSEIEIPIADAYIERYVAHAERGYIQISYDEPAIPADPNGPHDHVNEAKGCHTAMDLFRAIYLVQPTAIMLPPPPGRVYNHHRIVWGPKVNPGPI